MRRRRNELEYPDLADETASADEAHRAGADTQILIDAATNLLPRLGLF
jgi:hypothetical protein